MEKFFKATQALSEPYDVQITLYPDFVEVADDLASDFEESMRLREFSLYYENLDFLQKRSIDELNNYMLSISGHENERF